MEQALLNKQPSYVQIENFTELREFTMNARLTYIRHFQNRPGISGLIFYGVSYLTSLSIKIAARMYLVGFPVKVVTTYEEAVRTSLKLLDRDRSLKSEKPVTSHRGKTSEPDHQTPTFSENKEIQIQSHPDWIIQSDHYKATYTIINNHILHVVTQGYFDKHHLKQTFQLQEKLFQKIVQNTDVHIIVNMSGKTEISYHTRLLFIRAINEFYTCYSIKSLSFYGSTKRLRAAIYLGRPFVRFQVHMGDSLDEILVKIKEEHSETADKYVAEQNIEQSTSSGKSIESYTMDVLRYLGTLNLDTESSEYKTIEYPDDHPFRSVFDTIDLINHDLNQLALQRQKDDELKIEMERKLASAQKMEALGTLAGGIAHDFNNILTGIIGYCQLAKMNINHPDKASDKIDQIYKGAERAAELVKQILIFSRNTNFEKTPQIMSSIVKEALILLKSSIPSTIKIHEMITTHKAVLADPAKIHQIVMNLCTNAYQSMTDTGGVLTVTLNDIMITEPQAYEQHIKPGLYLKLDVSDTGHGIDIETMERIFDPYFTTKETGKGTGMGLSLVYAIVREHKGYIKATSTPGKGSSFSVYLPETKKLPDFQEKSRPALKISTKNEHILLVDDEESILESTREMLKDYGYKTSCYSNGVQAFEAFSNNPDQFDMLVTDMTMPGITGDVLTEKVLKIKPGIPVILCTGYNENMTESKALNMGIRRYIQKPIVNQSLIEIIQDVLYS